MNDQKAIETAIAGFIKAYNAGDLAGVLDYYADDLIKIRQGSQPESKSETAARVAVVFENFHSQVEVINDEINVSGDLAYTRGSFRVTLTPKSGGEAQEIDRRIRRLMTEANPWLADFDGARVAEERQYKRKSLAEGLAAFRQARLENLALLPAICPALSDSGIGASPDRTTAS